MAQKARVLIMTPLKNAQGDAPVPTNRFKLHACSELNKEGVVHVIIGGLVGVTLLKSIANIAHEPITEFIL